MKSFLFLALSLAACRVIAQNPLKSSSEKLSGLDHLSYSVITHNLIFENQETDTLYNHETAVKNDKFTGSYFSMKNNHTTYLYAGDQVVNLYSKDSTYRIEKPRQNQYFRSLTLYWAGQFEKFLSYPDRLTGLPDTLINGKESYHLRYYQKKDSLIGDYLTYHYHDIFIDQASFLPVLIISDMKFMYNDLPSRVTSVYYYQDYVLNAVDFPDLNQAGIPAYYRDINSKPVIEKPAVVPLQRGITAPIILAQDINGEKLSPDTFHGQVVLLHFTSVACPHAYSSIAGLKRIDQKFKNKNLKIVSIYDNLLSPENKVRQMITRFDLDFLTTLLNGDKLAEQYHSEGYPNFYLIDRDGKIAYYAGGYSTRIEQQLSEQLEELLDSQ